MVLYRDLATLYGVETKQLKRQVRRNIKRFPLSFMFELTTQEDENIRSQIGTLKKGSHSKYLPFAFTEHGILMLSSVLNSNKAIKPALCIILFIPSSNPFEIYRFAIFFKLIISMLCQT